jgi:hypothetical protein
MARDASEHLLLGISTFEVKPFSGLIRESNGVK